MFRALIRRGKGTDSWPQTMGTAESSSAWRTKVLWRKKIRVSCSHFWEVHFQTKHQTMSSKASQKLSLICWVTRIVCCPVQSRAVNNYPVFKILTNCHKPNWRQDFPLNCLTFLECPNPGVQEDCTLEQQQHSRFLCNHNNLWDSFWE